MQRPPFVRLTKHSREGHEDIEFSYVAIRRGLRPSAIGEGSSTQMGSVGRVGAVGREEAERIKQKEERVTKELMLDADHIDFRHETETSGHTPADVVLAEDPEEVEIALRNEAFHWPRLVFPPLKKSGHIIIDACTPEGLFVIRCFIPHKLIPYWYRQNHAPYYPEVTRQTTIL